MAILDRVRDSRGVFTDFGDVADQARKATNGFHPADLVEDASDNASGAVQQLSEATQGAAETAKEAVKDVSDATRDRIESLGEVLRDLFKEWSRASGDMHLDKRVDDIAQRLRAAMPAATFKDAVARLERELPDTDKDRYDRAYERGRVRTRSVYVAGGVAIGIAAGIAGAMLLDPQRGPARRARIARFKDDAARKIADRSKDVAERAKSMAADRGIGKPEAAVDPTGVTTGRDMVPVMAVGDGPVTDPSSTLLEPLADTAGTAEARARDEASGAIDAIGDRAVTASHG